MHRSRGRRSGRCRPVVGCADGYGRVDGRRLDLRLPHRRSAPDGIFARGRGTLGRHPPSRCKRSEHIGDVGWAALGDGGPAARQLRIATLDAFLVHEAMHTMQPSVLPSMAYDEGGAAAGLLDGPEGRTWLRLELRALSDALQSSGKRRARAVSDASAFRAARYAAASDDERERERALDVTEGLPEYTAWVLTRSPRADFVQLLDSAVARTPSMVRSFPVLHGSCVRDAARRLHARRVAATGEDVSRRAETDGRSTAHSTSAGSIDGAESPRRRGGATWRSRRSHRRQAGSISSGVDSRGGAVAVGCETEAARAVSTAVHRRSNAASQTASAQHQLRSARPGVARHERNGDGESRLEGRRRRFAHGTRWRTRHAKLGRDPRSTRSGESDRGNAHRASRAARRRLESQRCLRDGLPLRRELPGRCRRREEADGKPFPTMRTSNGGYPTRRAGAPAVAT